MKKNYNDMGKKILFFFKILRLIQLSGLKIFLIMHVKYVA